MHPVQIKHSRKDENCEFWQHPITQIQSLTIKDNLFPWVKAETENQANFLIILEPKNHYLIKSVPLQMHENGIRFDARNPFDWSNCVTSFFPPLKKKLNTSVVAHREEYTYHKNTLVLYLTFMIT